jgi:flagellar hook-basal body protein
LQMDSEGYLVNGSTGARIMGWQADMNTGAMDVGSPIRSIRIPIDSSVALKTNNVDVTGNLNSDTNRTQPLWTTSGSAVSLSPGNDPLGSYTTTFGVYDSLGQMHDITLTFVRAASDGLTYDPDGTGPLTATNAGGYYDSNNDGINDTQVPISTDPNLNANLWTVHWITDAETNPTHSTPSDASFFTDYPALAITTGETPPSRLGAVTFDQFGQIAFTGQSLSLGGVQGSPGSIGGAGTGTRWDINVDLSGLTMLNTAYTVAASSQDGLPGGGMTGFTLSDVDGRIYGNYSNGSQRLVGELALATFNNSAGLFRNGQNMYTVGLNSGLARIGTPGSGDRGSLTSGYVEGSNTDMSREFAGMILAQRGFQASTRIINTADTLLNELVNLRR